VNWTIVYDEPEYKHREWESETFPRLCLIAEPYSPGAWEVLLYRCDGCTGAGCDHHDLIMLAREYPYSWEAALIAASCLMDAAPALMVESIL
jgi:hypothetical protein